MYTISQRKEFISSIIMCGFASSWQQQLLKKWYGDYISKIPKKNIVNFYVAKKSLHMQYISNNVTHSICVNKKQLTGSKIASKNGYEILNETKDGSEILNEKEGVVLEANKTQGANQETVRDQQKVIDGLQTILLKVLTTKTIRQKNECGKPHFCVACGSTNVQIDHIIELSIFIDHLKENLLLNKIKINDFLKVIKIANSSANLQYLCSKHNREKRNWFRCLLQKHNKNKVAVWNNNYCELKRIFEQLKKSNCGEFIDEIQLQVLSAFNVEHSWFNQN